ncbi:MAG: tetratricopeptide (TPR) repeat protein [Hyphomicrobiaceae bacterium]|jgi:tetratricopeptide (TPR) repeat protein
MARAIKVRSKRKEVQASTRLSIESAQPSFTDAFLGSWIDDRLGDTENRLLVLLNISWPPIDDLPGGCNATTAVAAITSHNGYAIRRRGNQVIGVWGLRQCDPADPKRAMSAARTICKDAPQLHGVRCLLHVKKVSVAKGAQEDPDDAIVLAFAGVLDGAQVLASMPDAIVATETFKVTCGLKTDLLPISVPGAWTGRDASVLYALAVCPTHTTRKALPLTVVPPVAGPLAWASRIDALDDLKPLIIAAAIVGRVFTLDLLARMLGMERQRLSVAIAALQAMALISEEPSSNNVERFSFIDEDLQRFAYDMVPPRERLRLHRRVAEVLSQNPADLAASPPDQVARHHRIANNPMQSRRWLGKAAWHAIATDDAAGAVTHLEEALAQDADPTSVSASRRSLLQLLGVQLALAKGNGSDDVFDVYQRSIATSEQLPYLAWKQEIRSLWLAQSTHLVKGEVRAALTLGSLLLIHLQRQTDRSEHTLGLRILVHRMHALALMLSGQLHQALEHYDMVIRDYDVERHASLRFAYGSDQLALAHAHRAWTLALGCRVQEVPTAIHQARRVCDRLNHPHTTAHAVSVVAITSLASGAYDEALFAAREARAIAVEFGFPYWVAWADVMLAAVDAQEKPRTAYAKLEEAMAAYRATGASQLCPFVHSSLSAAALGGGQVELALQQADAGLALISQNGCILHRPKLLRCRARALFELDRADEADATLQAGYDDAHKSGATLFKRSIARDGLKHTVDQKQISWQTRYHAAI